MGCSRTPRLLLTRCWAEIFLESRKRKPQVAGNAERLVSKVEIKGLTLKLKLKLKHHIQCQ